MALLHRALNSCSSFRAASHCATKRRPSGAQHVLQSAARAVRGEVRASPPPAQDDGAHARRPQGPSLSTLWPGCSGAVGSPLIRRRECPAGAQATTRPIFLSDKRSFRHTAPRAVGRSQHGTLRSLPGKQIRGCRVGVARGHLHPTFITATTSASRRPTDEPGSCSF